MALNSDVVSDVATPQSIAAALDAIPDDVSTPQPPLEGTAAPTPTVPVIMLEPWATVDVGWVMPLAGMLVKLPYEQAAKATGDECWLVTDDQIELINPAMENAIKWAAWRFGAAGAIGHPLTALAVAVATLTAAKYGVYKFHEHQQQQGGPAPNRAQSNQPGRKRDMPAPQQTTRMDTSTTSGRTGESEGESSFVASREAVKATSLRSAPFVVAE